MYSLQGKCSPSLKLLFFNLRNNKSSYVNINSAYLSLCRGETKERVKPFPYESKQFTLLSHLFDKTKPRLSDESKVIVVEGLPGSNKTEVAKEIAEAFDLKYIPPFDHNDLFLKHGIDTRSLKFKLNEKYLYGVDDFFRDENPECKRIGVTQWELFKQKYIHYAQKALLHVLSTGQGVVCDTSVYSDIVYAKTLHKIGYISDNALNYYQRLWSNSMVELMNPHITVFLEEDIDVCKKNILNKQPEMSTSKVFNNPKYLPTLLEEMYNTLIPQMTKCGELHRCDLFFGGREFLLRDIEMLSLDYNEYVEFKFEDWSSERENYYAHRRRLYSSKKLLDYKLTLPFPLECEEYIVDEHQADYLNHVTMHPDILYRPGYNPNKTGYLKVLFKP